MLNRAEQTGIERMIQQGIINPDGKTPSRTPELYPYFEEVEYTTLEQAVANYTEDPYGDRTDQFYREAFGVSDPEAFLEDMGLGQYVEEKRRKGAFVGGVKSHTRHPNYYNMSDVFAVGEVVQRYGVPGAIVCLTYESDTYVPDAFKMAATGRQRYFVGNDRNGKPQFASMAIVPHAVRGKDGQIREIQTVEEAFGHPLEDIFVYAQTPLDPRGAGFSFKSSDGTHQEYIEGVLGKSWKELADNSRSQAENPGLVSLTQLHHVLFDLAIERLRKQGVLPSESHMPILSTDIRDISRGVLKHVNASEDTKRILGFSISPQEFIAEFLSLNPEAVETIYNAVTNLNNAEGARKAVMQHNERLTDDQKRVIFGLPDDIAHQIQQFAMKQLKMAFDPRSGILKKGKKIDPASYYPIMTSFFDVDIVSLHVQSWFFMQKVKRMQALLKHYKQTNPTIAVPEMDEWDITASMVHPTGIYYDLRAAETAAVSEIDLTGKSKSERNRMGPMIARIKAEHMARFYASLGNGGSGDSDAFKVVTEAVATEPILRWWASVIANLPDEL